MDHFLSRFSRDRESRQCLKCTTSKGTLFLWGSLNPQKYLWATSRVAEQAKSYRDLMYPTSRHNFYVTLKQKPMVDLRPCHISFCDTIHGGPLTTRAWYWNFILGIEYQFYCYSFILQLLHICMLCGLVLRDQGDCLNDKLWCGESKTLPDATFIFPTTSSWLTPTWQHGLMATDALMIIIDLLRECCRENFGQNDYFQAWSPRVAKGRQGFPRSKGDSRDG